MTIRLLLSAILVGILFETAHSAGSATCGAARTGACQFDSGGNSYYFWVNDQYSAATTETHTSTVVTIIDTVLRTTSTSVILPKGLRPTITNAVGTQVSTVTYSRAGKTMSTVIAFPTPFFVWPSEYVWYSTSTDPTVYHTVTLSTTIQPSIASLYNGLWLPTSSYIAADPRGLNCQLQMGGGDESAFCAAPIELIFPNQPALKTCGDDRMPGPALNGFTSTMWFRSVTTSLVGNAQAVVATTQVTTSQGGSTATQPTTTPVTPPSTTTTPTSTSSVTAQSNAAAPVAGSTTTTPVSAVPNVATAQGGSTITISTTVTPVAASPNGAISQGGSTITRPITTSVASPSTASSSSISRSAASSLRIESLISNYLSAGVFIGWLIWLGATTYITR